MARLLRTKYKISNDWILTVFKNIKNRGWYRCGGRFWEKTSKESARTILDTDIYNNYSVAFSPDEMVLTYKEQIEVSKSQQIYPPKP